MILRTTVLAFVALLALAAPGCGSDETKAVPSAKKPAAGNDFPKETAVALCGYIDRCKGTTLQATLHGEDCVTFFTKQFEDTKLGVIQALVADGTLVYDAALARVCLTKYGNASCDGSPVFPECDAIALGTKTAGEACFQHEECGASGMCGSSGTCPGACKPRPKANEACAAGDLCATGSHCGAQSKKCEPDLPSGAPCTGLVACADGLTCIGGDESKGVPGACGVQKSQFTATLGEVCDGGIIGPYCAPGGICELQGSLASNSFLCVAPYASRAICRLSAPEGCPAGQFCPLHPWATPPVIEATCTRLPDVGEGCGSGLGGDQLCGAAAACVSGRCVAMQRLGGVCSQGNACYSGSCVGARCVAPNDCGKAGP